MERQFAADVVLLSFDVSGNNLLLEFDRLMIGEMPSSWNLDSCGNGSAQIIPIEVGVMWQMTRHLCC